MIRIFKMYKLEKELLMVTLKDARRVIDAAEKRAREIGQPMNIAVADEGGNMVAHVRMDDAWTERAFDFKLFLCITGPCGGA